MINSTEGRFGTFKERGRSEGAAASASSLVEGAEAAEMMDYGPRRPRSMLQVMDRDSRHDCSAQIVRSRP